MPIAFLLHIELRNFKPKIYRDVLVAPDITLRKLHAVIQAAMGWENCHLYGFAVTTGSTRYWNVPRTAIFEPANNDGWGAPSHSDAKYKLGDVMQAPKDQLLYMYDFGDDWEHKITLKSILETEQSLPHLLKAQTGCPPEDCGGPPGAQYWAEVWRDKSHPEHGVAMEMFDEQEPGWLDFERLQKNVAKLQPRAKRSASSKFPK